MAVQWPLGPLHAVCGTPLVFAPPPQHRLHHNRKRVLAVWGSSIALRGNVQPPPPGSLAMARCQVAIISAHFSEGAHPLPPSGPQCCRCLPHCCCSYCNCRMSSNLEAVSFSLLFVVGVLTGGASAMIAANDNFANAILFTAAPFDQPQSLAAVNNVGATVEVDEPGRPTITGNPFFASVWWKVVIPTDASGVAVSFYASDAA
jgi:hypothetical protein